MQESPDIWGPRLWKEFHTKMKCLPKNLSKRQQYYISQYINNFHRKIPCTICKNHYKKNIKEHSFKKHLKYGIKLFNWSVDLHNIVNIDTGKKIQMSYNEAYKLYKCPNINNEPLYANIISIIIFLLTLYYLINTHLF